MAVNVIDTLAPKNSGAFPIIDTALALGGFMQVADITARDAITTQRRRHGLFVFVQSTGDTYQLDSGLTNADWILISFGGDAATVKGPASATDNAVARFDLTTGKLIQNSAVTIDDSGNIATAGTVDGRDVSADGALLDARLPTANEKAALAGTGTPSGSNKYVTNDDSRLSDARTPSAHATSHKHGGSDEIATATAAANAIPKAGAGGTLAYGWMPVGTSASTVAAGDDARFPTAAQKSALAGTGTPSGGNPYVTSDDSRLSDARTPTAHATTHQHGGGDEVGTATAAANAIPKAGSGGTLAIGWLPLGTSSSTVVVGNDARLPTAGEKSALAGTGTPGSGNKYVTEDYARLLTSDQDAALDGTSGTPNAGNPFVTNQDSRLSDARTPSSHATSHQHGGSDEVATATAAANAIPKAGAGGTLAYAWMPVGTSASTVAAGDDARFPTSGQKSALVGTSGTPGSGNKYVTDADARLPTANQAAALAGTGTPSALDPYVNTSDSRLSDSRAPTGSASGDLGGTYPNPTVAAIHETAGPTKLTIGAIADGEFTKRVGNTLVGATPVGSGDVNGPGSATDNALARFDGTTGKLIQNSTGATLDDSGNLTIASIITAGTVDGRDVSADGALLDARLPTANQKAALAGTGTPSGSDKYVNDSDSRMSDSRAPTGAAGGYLGGTYPNPDVRAIRETGGPTKLTIGAIADGQLAYRSGSTLIGGPYLLSEATADITLTITTTGNDSDPGRPSRISAGDYSAYPFLTFDALFAALPISMGKYKLLINAGIGNFDGFTISGFGGPLRGMTIIGSWGNWSVASGSQSGTAGTGTGFLQVKRPTGSSAWTPGDLAGAVFRVVGGGGYVADPLFESALYIEDNDADWLYLGGGGINGVDETTQFQIVYAGTRINGVAADDYFGSTYGIAVLNNSIDIAFRRFKIDVDGAGATFGLIAQRNSQLDFSSCELVNDYHFVAYGPAAFCSNLLLKSGAYFQCYGIENVTSYGVQCRNGTFDAYSFNAATIDYVYAKACTAGNALRCAVGGALTWGGNFNNCTHTPVYQRSIDKAVLGGAGFHGTNAGTARAIDLGDTGTWDLQGSNATGSSSEQVAVDGRFVSWTNLSAFGIVRRFGNILQWGNDAETLLHKLYIPVDPDNVGNEFSTDGTGYFGNKVKLAGALYAFGAANGNISARVGGGTVTDIKYIATQVTGFVGGSGVDHAKVKIPNHFVTDDTVGGQFGFVINSTDYIIDLYPTQSDTNINQLGDNVPLEIPPRSWVYWWMLNQYDAQAVVIADTLSHYPGVLPLAKGGTGQTTKAAAFDGLAPTSGKGDIIVHTGVTNTGVGVGADGQLLAADSGAAMGVRWEWPGNGVLADLVKHSTASGDRNIAIFDGTDGSTIQSAPVYIDSNGRMIVPASVGDELFTQGELTVALTAKYYGAEVMLGDAFVVNITALAGGGQTGATELGIRDSMIENASADGDSVILRVRAIRGFRGFVWNKCGYSIDVFPPVGGNINGLATDVAVSLPNNAVLTYVSTGTINYQCVVTDLLSGDVVGPATSLDTSIARFNGTDNKTIQDSLVTIDGSGNLAGIGNISLSGTVDGRNVSADGALLDTAVIGPGSATNTAVVLFDGTTGKLVKNSTVTIDGSGNISTSGTVDGRDISTDGTLLDTLMHGAGTVVDNTIARFSGTGGKDVQESNVVITDDDELYGNSEKVEVVSASTYVLLTSDNGKTKRFTHASGCTVTLPNNFPIGFNVKLAAWDADPVILDPDTGATLYNRQSHDRSAGLFAVMGVEVVTQTGTDGGWLLFGDTAA